MEIVPLPRIEIYSYHKCQLLEYVLIIADTAKHFSQVINLCISAIIRFSLISARGGIRIKEFIPKFAKILIIQQNLEIVRELIIN